MSAIGNGPRSMANPMIVRIIRRTGTLSAGIFCLIRVAGRNI